MKTLSYKKEILFALLIFMLSPFVYASENKIDIQGIIKTVDKYIEGARVGRSKVMSEAFHPDAQVYGYYDYKLLAGSIDIIYRATDKSPASTDLKAYIRNVDVYDSIANVRLESENWGGHNYVDYLNLVKIDGNWLIVNKIFHQVK